MREIVVCDTEVVEEGGEAVERLVEVLGVDLEGVEVGGKVVDRIGEGTI